MRENKSDLTDGPVSRTSLRRVPSKLESKGRKQHSRQVCNHGAPRVKIA